MSNTMTTEALSALLKAQGIDFEAFEHPPLHTCQDADRLAVARPGQRLKHLFLRDNYGRRHFILATAHDKSVDLKALSKQLQVSRLGFASAERLKKYLGIEPGCVSVLALVNDPDHQVEVLIDNTLWHGAAWQCHPLVNDRTWVVECDGIAAFINSLGHEVVNVDVPQLG